MHPFHIMHTKKIKIKKNTLFCANNAFNFLTCSISLKLKIEEKKSTANRTRYLSALEQSAALNIKFPECAEKRIHFIKKEKIKTRKSSYLWRAI